MTSDSVTVTVTRRGNSAAAGPAPGPPPGRWGRARRRGPPGQVAGFPTITCQPESLSLGVCESEPGLPGGHGVTVRWPRLEPDSAPGRRESQSPVCAGPGGRLRNSVNLKPGPSFKFSARAKTVLSPSPWYSGPHTGTRPPGRRRPARRGRTQSPRDSESMSESHHDGTAASPGPASESCCGAAARLGGPAPRRRPPVTGDSVTNGLGGRDWSAAAARHCHASTINAAVSVVI